MMSQPSKKVYFTAGPATIPTEVMRQAKEEFLNYDSLDIGIIEISHRSKHFAKILTEIEQNLRQLLTIPDNYSVLFMHGGAKAQFDAIALNLCSDGKNHIVDYIISGYWSELAMKGAKRYASVKPQVLNNGLFNQIPRFEELKDDPESTYRYYCDNETIHGLEFNYVPHCGNDKPLVCDMTSNFLSRPVDVSKYGVIFASSQKNCGASGLAFVIIRNDLIGNEQKITPFVLNYKTAKESNSISNTPPVFQIYMANLCLRWMIKQGGLEKLDEFSKTKSNLLYNAIDNSNGFYVSPVVDKESRSRMNVVFLLKKDDLLKTFLEEAAKVGLNDLAGHRSVGGLRASLYHGITIEDVERLVKFMNEFREKHA